MTAFFTSVALSALAGIGYLAVRHPKVYNEVLFKKPYLVAFVVLIAFLAWNAGVDLTLKALTPFIAPEKLKAAKEAASTIDVPPVFVTLWSFGLFGYLLLLSWIASHIDESQQMKKTDET